MNDLVAVVSVVLLASHLLAMNVPSAAPLVCVWLHLRGRRDDATADAIGRLLARVSLWSLSIGTILGAVMVALIWAGKNGGYWDAVQRFPVSAYGFALGELAFTAVCLAIYLTMWDRWRRRPWLHAAFAVLSTTNLLYHFPPLMIVLGNLASRPELVQEEVVTRPVFRSLLLRPDLLAQILHFVMASVAVAGVALMLASQRKQNALEIRNSADHLIAAGGRIALVASLIQLAVGVWLLVQLPGTSQSAVLGNDWLAATFFFLSVVAAFGILHSLARVAVGETSNAAVRRVAVLMLAIVLLMTATLWRMRRTEASERGALPPALVNGTKP